MDDGNLQFMINRLSHSELAKILLDAAADPEVRDNIAAAVETSEPQVVQQHGRSDSDSAASTAPPPYSATMPPYASSTMSLPSRHVHYSLTYLSNYDLSARNTPPVESNRPCICKNCKKMFWSHEGSVRVTDCVGHPGKLEKLHRVIPNRRQRRLVEAKYLDAGSGYYKCWTCCLQKTSAPGCSVFEHHVAA